MLPYLLAALLLVSAHAAGNADDLAALRALKDSISNWQDVSSGLTFHGWEDDDPCGGSGKLPWSGVMCMDPINQPGRVTELLLAFLGLASIQGTLPAELDKLTALRNLDFSGQAFSGSLPASWGANGGFASLQMMNLGQNQLEASLPSEWGSPDRFQNLQTLELFNNQLTGSVPESWSAEGSFSNLRLLVLSNNQLSGSLPTQWAPSLPDLEAVDAAADNAFAAANQAQQAAAAHAAQASNSAFQKLKNMFGFVFGTSTQPAAAADQDAGLKPVVEREPQTSRRLLQFQMPNFGMPNFEMPEMPGFGNIKKMMQTCTDNPNDSHCKHGGDGSSKSSSSSFFGSGDEEDWSCQMTADGKVQSCSGSSASSSPGRTSRNLLQFEFPNMPGMGGDAFSEIKKMMQTCTDNPKDSHCKHGGDGNSKSSSSSFFGGGDEEDWSCQMTADGKVQSCSGSSASSSPGRTTSRNLLQLPQFNIPGMENAFGDINKMMQTCTENPKDSHCHYDGKCNSQSSSSSSNGSGKQGEWSCSMHDNGTPCSCSGSWSDSSNGGLTSSTPSTQSAEATEAAKGKGFWGTAATTWWVWVLAILLAIGAAFALARRRNVYVMLRGGGSEGLGLPRFGKGKDNRESELF